MRKNLTDHKKECKKRMKILILLIIITAALTISINYVRADATQFNVCCEKTLGDAWCQNTLESNCDKSIDVFTGSPFRVTPTSCDATSFCKTGCCVDAKEGLCMQNTPEKVCEQSKGTWLDDSQCAVSQCNLGCCILGDQASFVTQTRCKTLSALYGLQTNFQYNIKDEASCIMRAHSQEKGACVFDVDNQKTCKFTTRQDCTTIRPNGNVTSNSEFYMNHLCSDESLGTNCGRSTKTICPPGKDEVYFIDTCGNQANIYDATKADVPSYWNQIIQKSDSCGFDSLKGNAGSQSCGNCDYFKGSICGKGNAQIGENVCRDLNCYKTQNGNNYKNGESWCEYQGNVGHGSDAVGTRHIRHLCINGEEIVEPCADFRNEVCIQDDLVTTPGTSFTEAACRVNRWQDCTDQTTSKDCYNLDKRDCFWKDGYSFSERTTSSSSNTTRAAFEGGTIGQSNTLTSLSGIFVDPGYGICLPDVKPGLKFWSATDSNSVCSLGSSSCTVGFERNILDITNNYLYNDNNPGKCVENCSCLTESWVGQMNDVCTSFGDCGAYVNVAGKYTEDGIQWQVNGNEWTLQNGFYREVKAKAGL